jgi:UDP-galactopyranose mutase
MNRKLAFYVLFLIVGCGFAGATLAERIATQLDNKVLIIDKRNHISGNSYDILDSNGVLRTYEYFNMDQ